MKGKLRNQKNKTRKTKKEKKKEKGTKTKTPLCFYFRIPKSGTSEIRKKSREEERREKREERKKLKENMSSFCARMGEDEPTDLYPGTYYLCLEQTRQEEGEKKKEKSFCQKSSVLRMKRPLDKTVQVRVVFVADPRRLKEPSLPNS